MDGEQLAVDDLERELGVLGYEDDDLSDAGTGSGNQVDKGDSKGHKGTRSIGVRALGKRPRGGNQEARDDEQEQEAAEEEEEEEEEEVEEDGEGVAKEEKQGSATVVGSRLSGAHSQRRTQPKGGSSLGALEPSVNDIWARQKPQRKRQRPRTGKTAGRVLPDEIANVLGQATNAYIMGNHDAAAEMFTEVVRQAPQHPDAYQTLAVIHQEKEQPASALELFYIAAKLTNNDVQLWHKVADLSFELDDADKAVEACRNALRLNPNPQIWQQLAHAYLRKKSYKSAHDQVGKMLAAFPAATDGLIEYGEHSLACGRKEAAEWAYRVYALSQMAGIQISSLLTDNVPAQLVRQLPSDAALVFSAVSSLLDMYLEAGEKDAEKGVALVDMCLDLLQSLRTTHSADDNPPQQHPQQQQQQHLPLDVATKYGLCHLKLGRTLPAIRALQPLHATNIDGSADSMQVLELKHLTAKQYFSKGMSTQAAKLLQSIFDSHAFTTLPDSQQTRLRLEHSEIQETLGNVDSALQSLLAALQLDANYAPAIRNFARLVRTSRPDMQLHATKTLYMHLLVLAEYVSQPHSTEVALPMHEAQLEVELGVEWALACKRTVDEAGKHNFVAAAEPLVDAWLTQSSHVSDDQRSQAPSVPLSALRVLGSYTVSPDNVGLSDNQNAIRKLLGALASSVKLHSFLGEDQMFQLLLDLLQILLQLNREQQVASIAQRAMTLTIRPLTEPQRDQLRALCHHLLGGISDLRTVTFNAFIASPTNIPLANAVSRMLKTPDSTSTQPLSVSSVMPVGKLLKQSPESLPLQMFFAHSCVARHLHVEAMTKYLDAYLLDPQQPLTSLSLGAYMLNLGSHPSMTDKRTVIAQAFSMLSQYASLRRSDTLKCALSQTQRNQEALYNIGRAFHQLELLHIAERFYRECLDVWDKRDRDEELKLSNTVTLEAAHNLAQIYRKSNARELALEVMAKYLNFESSADA